MKILIVTIDEPFYVPLLLEPLIKERHSDIIGITILSPFVRKTISEGISDSPIRLLIKRTKYYGFFGALRQINLFALYKILDRLSSFVKIKRFYSVRSLARRYSLQNIPCSCKTNNINCKDFIEQIRKHGPDIIFCLVAQIANRDFLNVAKIGCLNIHCSLLPKNQGREPLFWAMLKQEKYAGVTVHFMNERIDSGEIIGQESIRIEEKDSLHSLYLKATQKGSRLLLNCLSDIEKGSVEIIPQDRSLASYNKWPSTEDVRLFRKKGLRFFN